MARTDDLERIREGLDVAAGILRGFVERGFSIDRKDGGDPVTEADVAVDGALRGLLPRAGEGWLSEETVDDEARLSCSRVWVVDPVDGTKEFVSGIPEFCVSIGLVENGQPVAGGIANPLSGECIVGALGAGVTLNGRPASVVERRSLEGATVLASRSEVGRGEWSRFDDAPFTVRETGSVAYKLGLVSAGLADATWTLTPKCEWDVAAGVALVRAGGGDAWIPGGEALTFNRPRPRLSGLVASGPALTGSIRSLLAGV